MSYKKPLLDSKDYKSVIMESFTFEIITNKIDIILSGMN